MEDWKIQKDRGRCAKPGCPLAAEQEYHAILELPECLRIERCQRCFAEMQRDRVEMPFHWRVRRAAGGERRPVLDLESLRGLFDRLGDVAEPTDGELATDAGTDGVAPSQPRQQPVAGLRYLVALLLLRKRRLKMVDPQNEEQELADLVVVDPKIPEMLPVALFAPPLDPDRLGGLREELMAAIGDDSESRPVERSDAAATTEPNQTNRHP